MKLSLVLFLAVAIFATVTYAYPEPQPDPLAEALAEAFAEPDSKWKMVKNFTNGVITTKICKDNKGNNKCKTWVKENITADNIRKFLSHFEDELNDFCEHVKYNVHRSGCRLYRNFMKK